MQDPPVVTCIAGDVRQRDIAPWRAAVIKYQRSSSLRALWQITSTVVPYALLWWLMYLLKGVSLWLTIPLAVLSGALLVRVFIIFHDCGHGSFFKSHRANDIIGFICGVLTFTPYYHWRWEHAIHHGTAGHLDKRGAGDIWTMTVQEYLDASHWKRFSYRLARNPVVLFGISPVFLFVIWQRFASSKAAPRERNSVAWMNLALLCVAIAMSWAFGIGSYLLIQTVALIVAGSAGVWLFYVQHQFENAYWERAERWDYVAAALQGSSYYKLPRMLQWLSGNIGFHHIHHLNPRVPNYHLQACHDADPTFQRVRPITLALSMRSLMLRLWDESTGKLVGFGRVAQIRKDRAQQRDGADRCPPSRFPEHYS